MLCHAAFWHDLTLEIMQCDSMPEHGCPCSVTFLSVYSIGACFVTHCHAHSSIVNSGEMTRELRFYCWTLRSRIFFYGSPYWCCVGHSVGFHERRCEGGIKVFCKFQLQQPHLAKALFMATKARRFVNKWTWRPTDMMNSCSIRRDREVKPAR